MKVEGKKLSPAKIHDVGRVALDRGEASVMKCFRRGKKKTHEN